MANYYLVFVREDDSEMTPTTRGTEAEMLAVGVKQVPNFMVVRLCWQDADGTNLYRVIRADGGLGPVRDAEDS
jgi:hypothetical protein